jgi:chemotaxis protein methyltransferase CheR
MPAALRRRWFLRGVDEQDGKVKVAPEVRALVRFERVNLTDPTYPAPIDLDVIMCRNVLIYFRAELRARVIERMCRHLRPGGLLFLGHAETVPAGADLPLRNLAPTVYERTVAE